MSIHHRAKNIANFLKTTAIGGVFFLLPLIIIGAFLSKVVQYGLVAAKAIDNVLPLNAMGGYPVLLLAGVLVIVAGCFFSGLVAKRSFARRFTESLEQKLQIAFPRYTIVKDRLSGNIGGELHRSELKTVMVLGHDGCYRLGLEVERTNSEWITVFFPGSPDPWAGQVAIVPESTVRAVEVDFIAAMTSLEKLGRGLQQISQVDAKPNG
jgi:uncharacterized membrane protein